MYVEFILRTYLFSWKYTFNNTKESLYEHHNTHLEKFHSAVSFKNSLSENFKINFQFIRRKSNKKGFKNIIKLDGFKNLKISFLKSKASFLNNNYSETKNLKSYNKKKNILQEKKISNTIKILKLKKEDFIKDTTNLFFYQNVNFKLKNNKFILNCMAFKKI